MFGVVRRFRLSGNADMLASMGLLVSIGVAIFEAVWSIYLDSFLNNASLVGLVSAAITLLAFFVGIFSSRVLEITDERSLWSWSVWLLALCSLGFFLAPNFLVALVVTVAWIIGQVLAASSGGVLIRDAVDRKDIGSQEALQYVLKNIGWMIGPLIGGFLFVEYGLRAPFLAAAFFLALAAFHFRHLQFRVIEHVVTARVNPLSHFREFFRDSQRVKSYVFNAGMAGYWGFSYTYLPLFVGLFGFSADWLGWMLFAVALPLVVFGYFAGRLCDKGWYRRLLSLGFAATGFFTSLMFFTQSPWYLFSLILLASTAAAFIEGTRDAYFFYVTDQREEKRFVSTYFTARGIGSTVAKLLVAGVLLVFPFTFSFLAIAALMFLVSFTALTIKKSP